MSFLLHRLNGHFHDDVMFPRKGRQVERVVLVVLECCLSTAGRRRRKAVSAPKGGTNDGGKGICCLSGPVSESDLFRVKLAREVRI